MRFKGTVFSEVLFKDTNLCVVGPRKKSKNERYKVVYLLHGICGNEASWYDYSMVADYANKYNTFFIMPDAEKSFYTDMKYGEKFFTYITMELPEICKSYFNISSKREDTFIMGCSMGGYGALKCALTLPGKYKVCCAFSPGLLFLEGYLDEMRENPGSDTFGLVDIFYRVYGENLEYNKNNELLHLAAEAEDKDIKPIIYTTCGMDDDLYVLNAQFADEMYNLDLDFTFEEQEGNHSFEFFDRALKSALDKYL